MVCERGMPAADGMLEVGEQNAMLVGAKKKQRQLVKRVMDSWRSRRKSREAVPAVVGSKQHLLPKPLSCRVSDEGGDMVRSGHKVVVAVSRDEASNKDALRWAIASFFPKGGAITVVHVRPPVRRIPTPLGDFVPVEQVSGDIAAAYIRDANSQTEEFLLDHQWTCDEHKVDVDFVIVESDSVQKALVEQVSRLGITKLILGSASRNAVARRLRGPGIAGYVAKHAPSFCAVLVVSKGRLVSVREAEGSSVFATSSPLSTSSSGEVMSSTVAVTSTGLDKDTATTLMSSPCVPCLHLPLPLGVGRGQAILQRDSAPALKSYSSDSNLPRLATHSFMGPEGSQLFISPVYDPARESTRGRDGTPAAASMGKPGFSINSFVRTETSTSCSSVTITSPDGVEVALGLSAEKEEDLLTNLVSFTFNVPDLSSVDTSPLLEETAVEGENLTEVERLKLQLLKARMAVDVAQRDARIQALRYQQAVAAAALARQKMEDRQQQEVKLLEVAYRDAELAKYRAEQETKKREEAVAAADLAKKAVEQEILSRKEAEERALHEMEARKQVLELLKSHQQYREYTYEELYEASNGFSPDLKLGEGGYGAVYEGSIHHTTVAIKVLNPGGLQGSQEFQREVELLRCIHHPHMVMLLGCCPEKGCLVYEYMANGSLEDCLDCDDGRSPLPWYARFRIAAEVATALLFLHSSKPAPIVHRDLKPANILLDRNFVSKIGDVGLARLVPISPDNRGYNSVFHRNTVPVGTFAYIDPEYQRTGSFGPKSDVYALGIVLLQMLTGKPAVGIAEVAEVAVEMGDFEDILDSSAGNWPLDEAWEMARLALRCAEMKRKNRPDLDTEVLPFLAYCRQVAEQHESSLVRRGPTSMPTMFLCPIFQEVMVDPVVAADGHTYENEAIQTWLRTHDTSPMTNLKLAHHNLTPNHSIRSAIREWHIINQGHVGTIVKS